MDPCSGFWCPHAEQNQPRSRTREQKAPLPAPLMKTQKLAHPAARPQKTTPVTKLQVLRATWALLMSFNCERAQPANLGAVLAESGRCACWESHVSTSHESQLSPRRYHERCARGETSLGFARVQRPCQRCIALQYCVRAEPSRPLALHAPSRQPLAEKADSVLPRIEAGLPLRALLQSPPRARHLAARPSSA